MSQKFWTGLVLMVFITISYFLYQLNYGAPEGEKITIQRYRGDYISGDRFKDGHLIANRSKLSEWEFFELQRVDDSQVIIRGSDLLYVGFDNQSPSFVRARENSLDNNLHLFDLVDSEDEHVLIRNQNGNYFQIDENDHLIVGGSEKENAERFKINVIKEKSSFYLMDHQITLLSIGLFLVLISIIVFQYVDDKRVAVFLLFAGGLFVRLFMVELAHYLHFWDEQFHALVAKNMMDNPFKPMLFANPTLAYNDTSWIAGHVWLHKQPLFLWQMAMSMKMFGVNTLALRLPSVVMSSLLVPIIYRIGKIGFNQNVGFYAALLFALSNFGIQLAGGAINTDHNDVAFLFYVAASVWAWFEYENACIQKKKYWILLIGIFAGGAVLVKWLTGLLVFSGWGISILLSAEKRANLSSYIHLTLAFLVAVVVFLPWQVYILQVFPELSRHEYDLASSHFFESIENHGEPFWFHFEKIRELYGISEYLLLGCFALFLYSVKRSVYKVAVVTYILVIYMFFSLAITKMIAFTFCISFLIYLIFGVALDRLFTTLTVNQEVAKKRIYSVLYVSVVLITISYFNLNLDGILDSYTQRKPEKAEFAAVRTRSTRILQSLPEQIPNIKNYVLFNCKFEDAAPALFFTDLLDAHTLIPDEDTYWSLKSRNLGIAIFDNDRLPEFLVNDPEVIKIKGYHDY